MPTLLQISIEVNCGSIGRIAEHIGNVAMQNGWDSYITYARNHLPSKSKTIKIGNKLDIYWHGVNTRLFDNHCLKSTCATKVLIKRIKEINPDIILMHHIHGYFLDMRVLFNYLANLNIPIVWAFYDCWSITGHCAYFDYVGCNKWITGCYECPQKRAYPSSIFLDRSKRNYQLKKDLFNTVKNMIIIPGSEWLAGIIKQSFLAQYPMYTIHSGVDIDMFSPKSNLEDIRLKYRIENKFVILGVAGIWEPRKGLKDFIHLNNMIDHHNYEIILVGLNKQQIKNLPEEIIGIERTESIQELTELYSVADVFLNPTWEDTFPTTNLESLACGTPVITYRTGGSVESVSENTGFVVEKGDIEGLYNALKKVKEKGKAFYSQNCRQRAVSNYDKRERFKDYINLFYQLLGN